MRRHILAALVWGMMLPGCAGGPSPPPSVPVKGRVMQQGNALPGVVLTFWPQEQRLQALTKPPSGISESDGTFQISCPQGPYKVTAVAPPPSESVPTLETKSRKSPAERVARPMSSIPELYSSPVETPLQVVVPAAGVDDLILTIAANYKGS
jgi:hypothetical protein